MMDFSKIEKLIDGLVTENTTPEDAEKIAAVKAELGVVKNATFDFADKYESLRQKYVQAVTQSTFKGEPEDANPEPKGKTLDECIAEEEAKMKGAK